LDSPTVAARNRGAGSPIDLTPRDDTVRVCEKRRPEDDECAPLLDLAGRWQQLWSQGGRFTQSFGAYDDSSGKSYHVTVTMKGHCTSHTKAVGTFILVSKKYKHCNQNASWSATRVS
jgi:hypothetical protein